MRAAPLSLSLWSLWSLCHLHIWCAGLSFVQHFDRCSNLLKKIFNALIHLHFNERLNTLHKVQVKSSSKRHMLKLYHQALKISLSNQIDCIFKVNMQPPCSLWWPTGLSSQSQTFSSSVFLPTSHWEYWQIFFYWMVYLLYSSFYMSSSSQSSSEIRVPSYLHFKINHPWDTSDFFC